MDNEFEKEFEEIKEKVEAARKLLVEANQLSERIGVFTYYVSSNEFDNSKWTCSTF